MKNHKTKLEAQIRREIQRLVLKGDQEHEEEHIHTEDLIEALKKITDVPETEIDRIASTVRENLTQQFRQKRKNFRYLSIVTAVILFIIFIFTGLRLNRIHQLSQIKCKTVFTSQVSSDHEPVDNLQEARMDMESFTIFIRWENLPVGKHNYRIKIYDGNGHIAWNSEWQFYSDELTYSTWSTYHPKQNIDQPGQWKFEIYLEEFKILEKFLHVHPSL